MTNMNTVNTVAIVSENPRKSGDVFTQVLGMNMTMDAAMRIYLRQFLSKELSDQRNTALAYISIVEIPEQIPDEDSAETFYWDGKTIVLPENWLDNADSQDAVKDGKPVCDGYVVKSEDTEGYGESMYFDKLSDAKEQYALWVEVDKHPDTPDDDWATVLVAIPSAYSEKIDRESSLCPEKVIEGICGTEYQGKYYADCSTYYPEEEAD